MNLKDELLGTLYNLLTFLDEEHETVRNSESLDEARLELIASVRSDVENSIDALEGSTL